MQYIKGELDELEREEFFRLKKVQAKKKKDIEANESAARKALARIAAAEVDGEAAAFGGAMRGDGVTVGDPGNLLEPERDEDLLF